MRENLLLRHALPQFQCPLKLRTQNLVFFRYVPPSGIAVLPRERTFSFQETRIFGSHCEDPVNGRGWLRWILTNFSGILWFWLCPDSALAKNNGKWSCRTSGSRIQAHLLCEAAETDLQREDLSRNALSSPCALGLRTICGHTLLPPAGPQAYLKLPWRGCWPGAAERSCRLNHQGTGCCRCSLSWPSAQLCWAAGWGDWPVPLPWACCRLRATWKHRAVGHPPAPPESLLQLCQNHWSPAYPRHLHSLPPGMRSKNPSFLLPSPHFFIATQVTLRGSQSWKTVESQRSFRALSEPSKTFQ